jgi:uncharacterized protein GlcG (DUF336 family)
VHPAGLLRVRPTVGLPGAELVVRHVVDAATALGVAVCVAVVDSSANLVHYSRMDGSALVSARLAQDKAWTSAASSWSTEAWWEFAKQDPSLVHGLVKTDRLVVYGGGAPLAVDAQVVGGVGVSGASVEEDRQLAAAAALAFQRAVGSGAAEVEQRQACP